MSHDHSRSWSFYLVKYEPRSLTFSLRSLANHNKNYVIGIKAYESSECTPTIIPNGADVNGQWVPYSSYPPTINFDEAVNGWVSFYSYCPVFIDSIKSKINWLIPTNL